MLFTSTNSFKEGRTTCCMAPSWSSLSPLLSHICFLSATLPITSCLLHNLILTNILRESQRCAKANWSLLKGTSGVSIFIIPFSGMSCQELKIGYMKRSYVAKARKAAADQRWFILVTGNIAGGFLSPLFTGAV